MEHHPQSSNTGDASNSLPHIGLLRYETLVLRQLLAYSSPGPSIPDLGSNLPDSSIKDLLFLCVDIDTLDGYDRILPNQQFHIGLSIFDTRLLLQDLSTITPTNTIKSYQFHTGNSNYCKRASQKFLFGRSEAIHISELKPKIEALAFTRDIILIMHGDPDIKVLQNLDINLRPLYIIDTVKAAQFPLQLSRRISLEKLLTILHIPFTSLHAAGNDAHFILRALLMIVVKDAESQATFTPSSTSLLVAFRTISQAPRPLTTAEIKAHSKQDKQGAKQASKERKKERRRLRNEAIIEQKQ